MGSSVSKESQPLFAVGKSISTAICKIIQQDVDANIDTKSIIFPQELIAECAKFIGFFMDSYILNDTEKNSFYQSLIEHHQWAQFSSPLTAKSCIKCFDLLYRSSINGEHGKYSNESLLKAIENKPNVIIIYQTNYNHVFAVYSHEKVIKCKGKIKDDSIGLFLLRSQFLYGDKSKDEKLSTLKCPRLVGRPGAQSGIMWGWVPDKYHFSWSSKRIRLFTIEFIESKKKTPDYRVNQISNGMYHVGNELCGGRKLCRNKYWYKFKLAKVEAYQLL